MPDQARVGVRTDFQLFLSQFFMIPPKRIKTKEIQLETRKGLGGQEQYPRVLIFQAGG